MLPKETFEFFVKNFIGLKEKIYLWLKLHYFYKKKRIPWFHICLWKTECCVLFAWNLPEKNGAVLILSLNFDSVTENKKTANQYLNFGWKDLVQATNNKGPSDKLWAKKLCLQDLEGIFKRPEKISYKKNQSWRNLENIPKICCCLEMQYIEYCANSRIPRSGEKTYSQMT